MSVKKILLIIAAALLAAALAVTAAFAILRSAEKITQGNNVSSLAAESSVSEGVSSDLSEKEPEGIRLVISSPQSRNTTVTEPFLSFAGTCDPAAPLTVNGIEIPHGEDGVFSYQADLTVGKNTFSFVHKGETEVYTVNYRYVIISDYSPTKAQTYPSGSTLVATVTARRGSTVKASFQGKTISLSPAENANNKDPFIPYNGLFTLPSDQTKDVNLGKITYTATYDGKSETFTSASITCKKSEVLVHHDPNATPKGGKYINVGSGYIAEIVSYNAETFDGNVSNTNSIDWSRPTNNYLPQGTVDYCATSLVTYQDNKYVTLRAGYRVYLSHQDKPYKGEKTVVKRYVGSLPDHNEIGVSSLESGGGHTVLTLDSLWKAPFYFDLREQSYYNPSKQDYRISSPTYEYVDITFCYATVYRGEVTIPQNHPIFSSAKWIKNQSDCTLRLYLRRQGAFYGWDSYYNSNGQLCFRFLEPHQISVDEKGNFKSLNGAKILIDVGHGGVDIGAPGFDSKNHNEAIQNLVLANKLKKELEKAGAVVTLTRTGNTTSSTDDKITMLRRLAPDYCIAIHHNSSNSASANGFSAYYHHPFSMKAAEYVLTDTRNTGSQVYTSFDPLKWHYYFTARSTVCPVVLTENGFISNKADYANIISDAKNQIKAQAIAKGIVDYFRSLYRPEFSLPSDSENHSSEVNSNSTGDVSKEENSGGSSTIDSDVSREDDGTSDVSSNSSENNNSEVE